MNKIIGLLVTNYNCWLSAILVLFMTGLALAADKPLCILPVFDPLTHGYPGISGNKYSLERTFNLSPADWVLLATNSAAFNSYVMFTNAPQPGTNNFWRARHVP